MQNQFIIMNSHMIHGQKWRPSTQVVLSMNGGSES